MNIVSFQHVGEVIKPHEDLGKVSFHGRCSSVGGASWPLSGSEAPVVERMFSTIATMVETSDVECIRASNKRLGKAICVEF